MRAVHPILTLALLAGCTRDPAPPSPAAAPYAGAPAAAFEPPAGTLPPDTGFRVTPARDPDSARLVHVRIAPGREALDAPVAEPAPPPADGVPPPAAADERLQPPIPRTALVFAWPAGVRRRAAVELDLRVDESGAVSDVLWSGGGDDSALVGAATEAALRMRFFPALLRGTPVAVWCRQRLEPVR